MTGEGEVCPCGCGAPMVNGQPVADHPHVDPGDGRKECPTCGKWVRRVLHSCKGVPVTPTARARARSLPPLHGGYRAAGEYDGPWPPVPPRGPGGGSRPTPPGETTATDEAAPRDFHGNVIGEDGLVTGPGNQRLRPAEDPWPEINAQRQQDGGA